MSQPAAMSFNSQTRLLGLETRHRGITLLCAWVLLMPTLSFAILGDAPAIPVLAAIPLGISLLTTKALAATTRAIVYSLTISAVVAVFLRGLYPIEDDQFFLPAVEVLPLLTGLGISATFFRQTPTSLAIVLCTSVLTFMLQGSSLNDPTNATRLVLRHEFWHDRYQVFGFFLALQMLAFVPLLRLAQLRARKPRADGALSTARPWGMRIAWLGSVVLAIALLMGTLSTVRTVYQQMDMVLSPIYKWYIRQYGSRHIFPADKVSLTQTLDAKTGDHLQNVAIRVVSDQPPGYLRGRAYTYYENGSWSADDADTALVGSSTGTANDNLVATRFTRPTYPVEQAAKLETRIDVYTTRLFYSDVLVLPGDAGMVELITDAMGTNADGTLRPRRWDRGGAYTGYVPSIDQVAAYAGPNPDLGGSPMQIGQYLQLPDGLQEPLAARAEAIMGPGRHSPDETIRRIASHVRDSHDYTLNTVLDGEGDPVLQFLDDKKSGHCEYFASTTALLLRARGIPTRYVTGFVCFESSPVTNTWTSRFADCHAWVEAYDRRAREWRLVESTPASGIPTEQQRAGNWFAELREYLAILWAPFYAKVKRGYVAEAIYGGLGSFIDLFAYLYYEGPWYLSWPLTLLPIFWFIVYYRRRHPRGGSARRADSRAELIRLHRSLERLLLRYRIKRQPSHTLRDLSRAIEQRQVPRGELIIDLLKRYERLRYHPDPPSADDIAAFESQLTQVARDTAAKPA